MDRLERVDLPQLCEERVDKKFFPYDKQGHRGRNIPQTVQFLLHGIGFRTGWDTGYDYINVALLGERKGVVSNLLVVEGPVAIPKVFH